MSPAMKHPDQGQASELRLTTEQTPVCGDLSLSHPQRERCGLEQGSPRQAGQTLTAHTSPARMARLCLRCPPSPRVWEAVGKES